MLVLDGEEGSVRSTVAERDAEALAVAEGDVGTKLAGRFEQGQGEEIGGDDDLAAVAMDLGSKSFVIDDGTISAGILWRCA